MRKAVLLVALAMIPLASPFAFAETTCMPDAVGVCVSHGTDAGNYAAVCRVTFCAGATAQGAHTLEAHDTAQGSDDAALDAGTQGATIDVEQHDRIDITSREDVSVLYVDAEGRNVYAKAGMISDHPWIEADITDQHTIITSHACFVANADGTTAGLACGDWANGELQPVLDEHLMDSVDEIRNDPLVRCVLTRQCIV